MIGEISPVVVGALGGSGTRAVARIVERGGRFMGANLNHAHDALDIAHFDQTFGPRYLRHGETWRYRTAFERAVRAHCAASSDHAAPWGWKHPHSYLFIEFLNKRFPGLHFIHLVRDGRDMAFSNNQRQLRRYGHIALGNGDDVDPVRRIRFWAWANLRAAEAGESLLGERYLRVRLEDICETPIAEVERLNRFTYADPNVAPAVQLVERPSSLGRWRYQDPSLIARLEDAAGDALRRFGYT